MSTNNGSITFIADDLELHSTANVSSLGQIKIRPNDRYGHTLGTPVPNTLSLGAAELNTLHANTLIIGDDLTGNVNVTDFVSIGNVSDSVQVEANGDIVFSGSNGAIAFAAPSFH